MRKDLTPIRGTVDRPLAARWFLAHHSGKDPRTISRNCTPVACDVRNRSSLYDVTEALGVLERLRSRRSRSRCDLGK